MAQKDQTKYNYLYFCNQIKNITSEFNILAKNDKNSPESLQILYSTFKLTKKQLKRASLPTQMLIYRKLNELEKQLALLALIGCVKDINIEQESEI